MISGGNATVFVSDLELAVRFYTDTLGLPLKERFENDWAAVDAGNGLIIGLHPPAPFAPKAGVSGGIAIGLDVTDALETVVDELTRRVLERLAPDTARDLVADIVADVAERLVREEIERIRGR